MQQQYDPRVELRNRYQNCSNRISALDSRAEKMLTSFTALNSVYASASSGLASVRGKGYIYKAALEGQVEVLKRDIDNFTATSFTQAQNLRNSIRMDTQRLLGMGTGINATINFGDINLARTQLQQFESEIAGAEGRYGSALSSMESSINNITAQASQLQEVVNDIDTFLGRASTASFQLKPGENFVSAFEATQIEGKEKTKGMLFFTNERLIFEKREEVVLEKKLFIATKKQLVKEVKFDYPIGYVKDIVKGRVGFLAWGGVYVNFKPPCPINQVVFDVKDVEIPQILEWSNYIISGDCERDILAEAKAAIEEEKAKLKIETKCPTCGAPIAREIVRGERSIRCEYCGTVIPVG
ncbi:MAG: zinc ribbon domain-containing protein [Candidatus Thermoplasmatota archaeon]